MDKISEKENAFSLERELWKREKEDLILKHKTPLTEGKSIGESFNKAVLANSKESKESLDYTIRLISINAIKLKTSGLSSKAIAERVKKNIKNN